MLKISGTGAWPIEDYLEGPLLLPFVEPAALSHEVDVSSFPVPSSRFECRDEYLELAGVWDELGVLHLACAPVEENHFCRAFNVYKSAVHDRQVGDRRIPNFKEYRIFIIRSELMRGELGPIWCLFPFLMQSFPFVSVQEVASS